jgi:surface antigen
LVTLPQSGQTDPVDNLIWSNYYNLERFNTTQRVLTEQFLRAQGPRDAAAPEPSRPASPPRTSTRQRPTLTSGAQAQRPPAPAPHFVLPNVLAGVPGSPNQVVLGIVFDANDNIHMQHALDTAPPGRAITWQSLWAPSQRYEHVTITPFAVFPLQGFATCRAFTFAQTSQGLPFYQGQGAACRVADGTWTSVFLQPPR